MNTIIVKVQGWVFRKRLEKDTAESEMKALARMNRLNKRRKIKFPAA